jgi:hypothetical protein
MSRYQEGMTLDEAYDAWATEQDWKPTALMEEAFQQGWLARRLCDPASTPAPANTHAPEDWLLADIEVTAGELRQQYELQHQRCLDQGIDDPRKAVTPDGVPVLAPILTALANLQAARARLMEGNRS